MDKKNKLYVPIGIGAVIIIVALVFLLGCEKNEPKIQITEGGNVTISNTTDSTSSNPTPETPVTSTPDTNNMPPPVPPEPTVPSTPTTPVYSDVQGNIQCTDTDGGMNYTVIGTLTLTDNGSVTSKNTDYCRSVTTKWKGYVYEYYCNDTAVATSQYKCPKGCSGGKCN